MKNTQQFESLIFYVKSLRIYGGYKKIKNNVK